VAEARADIITAIVGYVRELEGLGVPVERVILFGSHLRGDAGPDSDIDLAVFSEAFGPPDYLEFAGLLSRAKWNTEPMIEAIGYHPSALDGLNPISFLGEIVRTGKVVYRRGVATRTRSVKTSRPSRLRH
jgi:predicted nucleotidyltransferase